jgi:hypothetical protein
LFLSGESIATGVSSRFWRPVQRIGWTIEGFSIAARTNNSSTISVQLKHEDESASVVLLGTASTDGLSVFYPLNTNVLSGRYFFDVVSGDGMGLQVTLQLRKNIVSNE